MKLNTGQSAALDSRHEPAAMLDHGARVFVGGFHRIAVREVDVLTVEAVEDGELALELKRVPAHMGHRSRLQANNRPTEKPEAGASLLALLEEHLEPDADTEYRPSKLDAFPKRVIETPRAQAVGTGGKVTDARDHGQWRLAHRRRVGRDLRLGTGAGERRTHTAQVPGSIVGEYSAHSSPFVEATVEPAAAQALASALASALNAASATWWSSFP